jgi:hypothetical protein
MVRTRKGVEALRVERFSDIFLVPDGTAIAWHAAQKAAQLGIRTRTVVVTGVSDQYRTLCPYAADTIFCYGTECRDILERHFPGRHLVLSGNPVLYRYPELAEADHPPLVLVATSAYEEDESTWMRALLRAFDRDACHIAVKPHPSYPNRYLPLQEELRGHTLLAAGEPLEPWVARASVVVTDHSQVGKDAHLLGKAVISVRGARPPLYLNDIPSIVYCAGPEELIRELRRLLADPHPVVPDPDFVARSNWGNGRSHHEAVLRYCLERERTPGE